MYIFQGHIICTYYYSGSGVLCMYDLIHLPLPCCSIAVTTEGKHAILTPEVLERLMQLLEDESSEVRLNTTKLLSLLAETPQGKETLKTALQKVYVGPASSVSAKSPYILKIQLQDMSVYDESDMVKKTAYTATRIIQWLP